MEPRATARGAEARRGGYRALRKILAFNVIGSGVFLLLGAIARRGAAAGMGGDPVPQALLRRLRLIPRREAATCARCSTSTATTLA